MGPLLIKPARMMLFYTGADKWKAGYPPTYLKTRIRIFDSWG
jgi:hypothetical protein